MITNYHVLYQPSLISQKRSKGSSLSQVHLCKWRSLGTEGEWRQTQSPQIKKDLQTERKNTFFTAGGL